MGKSASCSALNIGDTVPRAFSLVVQGSFGELELGLDLAGCDWFSKRDGCTSWLRVVRKGTSASLLHGLEFYNSRSTGRRYLCFIVF